jgi:hypothetical protein
VARNLRHPRRHARPGGASTRLTIRRASSASS